MKSVVLSSVLHSFFIGCYYFSYIKPASADKFFVSGLELERPDIEIDIPPDLIGGTVSPVHVDKQEWIDGIKKEGSDSDETEVDTNKLSGNGTDKDGYLFSFNGDAPPRAIVNFDLRQYYLAEAKSANIKEYQVTVLVQIDENGTLISSNITSGEAPYGFNEQALKIVKRIKFYPGYKRGNRVKMAHYLPVIFSLN